MPHLDASTLERDVDGVALLGAALGVPMPEPVIEVPPVSPIVTSRPGLQVLVVESDRLLRESISIQLHLHGHVVLEVDTGEQALATIQGQQAVDMLLTEIDMAAGPDGWALAREARLRHPSVAVIYTSAQPVELTRRVSGSLFVEKPYPTQQILNAIQELTSGTPVRDRGGPFCQGRLQWSSQVGREGSLGEGERHVGLPTSRDSICQCWSPGGGEMGCVQAPRGVS
jgi:CheY-like chemotaxis protein